MIWEILRAFWLKGPLQIFQLPCISIKRSNSSRHWSTSIEQMLQIQQTLKSESNPNKFYPTPRPRKTILIPLWNTLMEMISSTMLIAATTTRGKDENRRGGRCKPPSSSKGSSIAETIGRRWTMPVIYGRNNLLSEETGEEGREQKTGRKWNTDYSGWPSHDNDG